MPGKLIGAAGFGELNDIGGYWLDGGTCPISGLNWPGGRAGVLVLLKGFGALEPVKKHK